MRNYNQLMRLLIEAIFIMVGAFLLTVAWRGQYVFDARRPTWLILAIVQIGWGVQTWWSGRQLAGSKWRAAATIGGASLVLGGTIMLLLTKAPFGWVAWLVAAAGCVFILRGLITAALIARTA